MERDLPADLRGQLAGRYQPGNRTLDAEHRPISRRVAARGDSSVGFPGCLALFGAQPGAERHRPVDQPVLLVQADGSAPGVEQIGIELAEPRLRVTLARRTSAPGPGRRRPSPTHRQLTTVDCVGEALPTSEPSRLTASPKSLVDAGHGLGGQLPSRPRRRCAVICSGREPPVMAVATLSFCSTQATASWAMVSPSASASGAQLLDPGQGVVGQQVLDERRAVRVGGARALGHRLAGLGTSRSAPPGRWGRRPPG